VRRAQALAVGAFELEQPSECSALQQLGREHGVEARFVCDGDRLSLSDGRRPRWTRNRA
jgi:hypothetical protein